MSRKNLYRKELIASIILIAAGLAAISSCKKKENKTVPQKTVNPNGDSELAITMRGMMAFSKELKTEIETKGRTIPYPETIKKMLTAKETEGMIEDRTVYTGFAHHYLASLDAIYVPKTDIRSHFNTMVESCISCHSNYCQGPIPAIKKLYIK